jgi:hypothetical protein
MRSGNSDEILAEVVSVKLERCEIPLKAMCPYNGQIRNDVVPKLAYGFGSIFG